MQTKFNRLIGALISTIIFFSALCQVPLMAAPSDPTLSVSSASGLAGERVTISISVDANSGITGGSLNLGFDNSLLSFNEEDYENTGGLFPLNVVLTNPDNIRITFFNSLGPITDARTLVKLSFQLLPGAVPGVSPLDLSVAQGGVAGTSGLISVNTSNGSIITLPDEITFDSLTANGTANSVTTTSLTLTFSQSIPGLTASNITVTGATKGTLTGTGPSYTLGVSDIANQGDTVTVAVTPPTGYSITPASRNTIVHKKPFSVTFISLTADSTVSLTSTTLTLTFSQAIPGLTDSNITVTGATKSLLSVTGSLYRLRVFDISSQTDTVTVTVKPPTGYSVSPASRSVIVRKEPLSVTFDSLTANGTADSVTTTALALTFSQAIPGLTASNITVAGATKGTLTGTGPSYTLGVSDIANQGDTVTVTVTPPTGYSISPASLNTTVHFSVSCNCPCMANNHCVSAPDL